MSDPQLIGRIALVMGGLRGIGLACTRRLANDGAEVVVCDLDDPDAARPIVESIAPSAAYIRVDVSQESDWQALRDLVMARHGKLHILVNNAGSDLTGRVETIAFDDWRRAVA